MSKQSKPKLEFRCPHCHEKVEENQTECPYCMYPLPENKKLEQPESTDSENYKPELTDQEYYQFLDKLKNYFKVCFTRSNISKSVKISIIIFLLINGYRIIKNVVYSYLDNDVYWVEILDGSVEWIMIPDGCGLIIEKMVNNEPVTEEEILKLRNIPKEKAMLLFEGLKVSWYKDHGWNDTVGMRLLLLVDEYNFENTVFPQEVIQPN